MKGSMLRQAEVQLLRVARLAPLIVEGTHFCETNLDVCTSAAEHPERAAAQQLGALILLDFA